MKGRQSNAEVGFRNCVRSRHDCRHDNINHLYCRRLGMNDFMIGFITGMIVPLAIVGMIAIMSEVFV